MSYFSFKALSRMSSSPTLHFEVRSAVRLRFKALSRMSSSPTDEIARVDVAANVFQSAVAHELFSDAQEGSVIKDAVVCFKALSRMSSSPTASESALPF